MVPYFSKFVDLLVQAVSDNDNPNLSLDYDDNADIQGINVELNGEVNFFDRLGNNLETEAEFNDRNGTD
jgi:hypothetical protein